MAYQLTWKTINANQERLGHSMRNVIARAFQNYFNPLISTRNLGLLTVLTYTACVPTNEGSRIKIDAGQSINSSSTNKVEGVFYSMTQKIGSSSGGACTGSAVSTTTAITAAHCVANPGDRIDPQTGKIEGKQYCINNAIYKKVCSKEIYAHPDYLKLESQDGRGTDFAWVVFPEGTFKYVFSMNSGAVAVGDQVVFVGYSEAKLNDPSKGSKRFGWNKVEKLLERDRLDIFTRYGGKFDNVAVSPGDSGGPMLKNCQVTGVASRMTEGGQKQSIHTNLTHPESINTLKAASSGAYFCGLSGNDANYCPPATTYKPIANASPASKDFPCVVDSPAAPNSDTPPIAVNPPSPAPQEIPAPVPAPAPVIPPQSEPSRPPQTPPPSSAAQLDCNKDYRSIRQGGNGVCLNRSSGFCYRYANRDVQYGVGRVSCR